MSVGGRDIQGRDGWGVHRQRISKGRGAATVELLAIGIVGCGQSRATTGIGRRRGHDYIYAIPYRTLNLNVIPNRCGRRVRRQLIRKHGQGIGESAPRIRHHRVRRGIDCGARFHGAGPFRRLLAGTRAARPGARRTEGGGEEVKVTNGIV